MVFSWTGVVALGVLVAGAVGSAFAGQTELAMVLAGAAGGCLLPAPAKLKE